TADWPLPLPTPPLAWDDASPTLPLPPTTTLDTVSILPAAMPILPVVPWDVTAVVVLETSVVTISAAPTTLVGVRYVVCL
ncbi:MAG: hypothetical protein ACK53Y_24885, partial [bacterium]